MPKPHWNAHSDLLALARSSVSYGNPSVLRANAGISAETGRSQPNGANRNRSLGHSLLALFNFATRNHQRVGSASLG
jgi:hypothetical protein